MNLETITKAAMKTIKGKIYQGRNHNDIMRDMMWDNNYPNGTEILGFITNNGRFVDRQEAAKIAFESGQTNSNTGCLQSFSLTLKNANKELVEA